MIRIPTALLSLALLAGCGAVDSGSDNSARSPNIPAGGPEPTIEASLISAEERLDNQVETVVLAQEDQAPDLDMSGTWVEFWAQVGRNESKTGAGIVEFWKVEGFTVFYSQDQGASLNIADCRGLSDTIPKTLASGTITSLDHHKLGPVGVEVTNNNLVKFQPVTADSEDELFAEETVQLTYWVKVDEITTFPAGAISQNSGEIEFNCGEFYIGEASFSDGEKQSWHWVDLEDVDGSTYSSIGDRGNRIEPLGDPAIRRLSGNSYEVILNGINSIVTVE